MLGRRESQGDFFRPDHTFRDHVGEETFYGLLARQGAEWFRDEDFVALYREDFGRPSVPPSQLAIALLLQAHDCVSDEEAIARSAFDLRWKVALGLELDEKLCAKSTLQRFRAQLVLQEATGQIFDRGVEACRAAGLLKRSTLSAAIDTTPILGRGAVRDTPTTSSRMGSGTSWTRPAGSRAGSERRSWRPRD
jgi:transposase